MTAARKRPGAKTLRMSVGQAVRCAAMDCEASRPQAAMLIWQDEHGRVHKRVLPGNVLLEDGLLTSLNHMPPGDTAATGSSAV